MRVPDGAMLIGPTQIEPKYTAEPNVSPYKRRAAGHFTHPSLQTPVVPGAASRWPPEDRNTAPNA